jgi:pimeloyl-[acyl-carrier protein] methyl ester esterase
MRLHTETSGQGSNLFLVHGWCSHSGIWDDILPALMPGYRVTRVDLPGHGRSRELPMPATLPALARLLGEVAPENAVWLGWSLGGLACLRAAMDFPEQLRALVLVSTTPCFISTADWPDAMPLEQLQELTDQLRQDCRKAIQRFLALQVSGGAAAHTVLRRLRAVLFALDQPSAASLDQGLRLLRDSDVRSELAHVAVRTLILTGQADRLIPPQAGKLLATAMNHVHDVIIPGAAHVPFMSHPVEFMTALRRFLQSLPVNVRTQAGNRRKVSARRVT